jgi:hypothetical protein
MPVANTRWQGVCALGVVLSLLAGCGTQATYMRGWEVVPNIPNRWTGGTIKAHKLSTDEAAVYDALGAPGAIRFFRTTETRQPVYEWIYLEREEIVWFVERQRVEYVTVDTNTSGFTKEARETLEKKAVAGGVLGAVVGSVAAGMILFGNALGLRD